MTSPLTYEIEVAAGKLRLEVVEFTTCSSSLSSQKIMNQSKRVKLEFAVLSLGIAVIKKRSKEQVICRQRTVLMYCRVNFALFISSNVSKVKTLIYLPLKLEKCKKTLRPSYSDDRRV